jgi:hypothetical protein
LQKVCAGLPPTGTEDREKLRGKNKSLKDYILLLSRNDGEAEEERGEENAETGQPKVEI